MGRLNDGGEAIKWGLRGGVKMDSVDEERLRNLGFIPTCLCFRKEKDASNT